VCGHFMSELSLLDLCALFSGLYKEKIGLL